MLLIATNEQLRLENEHLKNNNEHIKEKMLLMAR